MFGFLATLLLFASTGCQSLLMNALPPPLPEIDFIHRVELDQQGAYVLLWTPGKEDVLFEVQVRTKGYVGLGFSPTGGMVGADIVIGWVDRKGKVHFSDRHASGQRTPAEDASQDYELLGGYSNNTHTVLRFSRPWITCDDAHDVQLADEDTVRVIWAYDAVLPDPSKLTLNRHDHRGVKSLYLKEPKMMKPVGRYEGRVWDVRAPQVELPEDLNTVYWCKLYKIPNFSSKQQVIGYIPLIDEVSLPHVHHMLLYECTLENSDHHFEKWVREKGAQCYSWNMPVSWTACSTPIVAWAIGSEGEMLPKDVGFPLGEKHGGATYFLLETHYDNPTLKKGIIDNSGLRMFLTDRLRKYDAGILTLGHKVEPSMIIPPGRVWSTTAHCTSGCTQKTLPPDGIKVFSGILHAHLLGRSLSLQHIRDGTELEPLIVDNHYDFNYQQARIFTEEKTIKPGDHLITNCIYNATERSKPTFGGFGTEDEMCLVFLGYYPKQNLGECYSRPDLALLFHLFGIQNLYENDRMMKTFTRENFNVFRIDDLEEQKDMVNMSNVTRAGLNALRFQLVDFFRIVNISEPESLRGKTFYDILTADSTWRNQDLINNLQEAVTKHTYEPRCLYSGRGIVERLPKKANVSPFIPYKAEVRSCSRTSNRTWVPQTERPLNPPILEKNEILKEKLTGTDTNARQTSENQGGHATRISPPVTICLGVYFVKLFVGCI